MYKNFHKHFFILASQSHPSNLFDDRNISNNSLFFACVNHWKDLLVKKENDDRN